MWKILDLSNKQAHIFLFFSGKVIAQYTVWKFQDFCITQILREINFEDSRSAKILKFPHCAWYVAILIITSKLTSDIYRNWPKNSFYTYEYCDNICKQSMTVI